MELPRQSFRPLAVAIAALAVAAAAASAVAAAAVAQETPGPGVLDLRRQQPVTGDAHAGKALATVCGACHGTNGVGIAPNFPNLAGQSATYLYVQLKTFKDGHRNDPVMTAMAAPLDDTAMRDLAAYFASLPPRADATRPDPHSPGSRLFSDGDPARGIPPCQGCHGAGGTGPRPDAGGDADAPRPPWATIPRLQGQSGAYLAKALQDFRGGARAGTSNAEIMHGVAKTLEDADIQALSDFVDAK